MRDLAVYRKKATTWHAASYRLVRLSAEWFRLEWTETSNTGRVSPNVRRVVMTLEQTRTWNESNDFGIDVEAMGAA